MFAPVICPSRARGWVPGAASPVGYRENPKRLARVYDEVVDGFDFAQAGADAGSPIEQGFDAIAWRGLGRGDIAGRRIEGEEDLLELGAGEAGELLEEGETLGGGGGW